MIKLLLSLTISLFVSLSLFATGVGIIDADKSIYIPLQELSVDVNVNNQIATVISYQKFYNESFFEKSVKFAFPLPEDANPISFRYRIEGGDWQEASFNAANQNASLPGSGGATGGSGGSSGTPSNALLEHLGSSPFYFDFTNPIPGNKELEIEIIYVQLLKYEFGIVDFHYPSNYNTIQTKRLNQVRFNYALSSDRKITNLELADLYGTTYDLNANAASISFELSQKKLDYDFDVKYQLDSDQLGSYALSTKMPDSLLQCDNHGSGFLTMILEPQSNEDTRVLKKNFSLVIDRSGSMNGNKMKQARDAASFIVNNLNDGDFFNIVDFSSTVSSFKSDIVPYSTQTKSEALSYISSLEAGGGTNISESLSTAIEQFGGIDSTKANIIIFFTDGAATSGITSTNGILNEVSTSVQFAETGIFLFTFGIGDNANKQLLTALALENKGLAVFLENNNLQEEISAFFLKINNPVLINTEISFTPDIVTEIYPNPIPNLYKGQQLILSGRYKDPQLVNMKLKGSFYNSIVEYDFPINLSPDMDPELSVLPQIWAKQVIDDLSIEYYLANSSEQLDIQKQIDDIGSCYGVVNVAFNSFEDTSLEIDLYDFVVRLYKEDQVQVQWTTLAEISNDYFVVERSCDGINFESIHQVKGNDSFERQDYEFIDPSPCRGINYYRIAAHDINGHISYTYIKAINLELADELVVFPIPVDHGNYLFVNANSEEELELTIFNTAGQLLFESSFIQSTSLSTLQFKKGNFIYTVTGKNYKETGQFVVR